MSAPLSRIRIEGTQLDGRQVDISINGSRITRIRPASPDSGPLDPTGSRTTSCEPIDRAATASEGQATQVIDGRRTAALSGLMNAHTHSAMAILRSYADDMPLMPWLQEKIWPFEAKLSEDDVYWGARLACIEMIRTGTTFFSDMYWHFHGTARAARDSGMRALVSGVFIDMGDEDKAKAQREEALEQLASIERYGPRLQFAFGPHAIYTVGESALRWIAETAQSSGTPVHIHLSETQFEVDTCLQTHGLRPVAYLDRLGLLGPRTLTAHSVHLNDEEIALLAERGVHPIHNPISNLKLSSGGPMPYAKMRAAGLNVLIGTDGCASNNNLDLFEELKFAALMAKHHSMDPTTLPASEALSLATRNPAKAYGLDCGTLQEGALADLILIDLDHPMLFPGHALDADLVYGGGGRAVKTTICDGRVLMLEGVIEDEMEIRAEVSARLARLAEA